MGEDHQPHANFHGDKSKHLYLGNRNLPTANAEFEWTEKMVADLKKCKRNLLYFAENFFTIVNLDRGREKNKAISMSEKGIEKLA